jgi:sarcosine oxidase subunit gamma
MSEPTMRSPLHSFGLEEQAKPIDGSCGVWANEIPHLGYISLRGNAADPAFEAAASSSLGVPLPLRPCTFVSSNGITILWLSPDEWMIVCPRSMSSALLSSLRQALAEIRSQIVDNSGGYTQVIIEGRNALDVLQHVSVYDFAGLEPGRVVGTTFGKSSVYAFRQGDGYRLVIRRSFADYIWRYLVRAATPYGLGIADLASIRLTEKGVAA